MSSNFRIAQKKNTYGKSRLKKFKKTSFCFRVMDMKFLTLIWFWIKLDRSRFFATFTSKLPNQLVRFFKKVENARQGKVSKRIFFFKNQVWFVALLLVVDAENRDIDSLRRFNVVDVVSTSLTSSIGRRCRWSSRCRSCLKKMDENFSREILIEEQITLQCVSQI